MEYPHAVTSCSTQAMFMKHLGDPPFGAYPVAALSIGRLVDCWEWAAPRPALHSAPGPDSALSRGVGGGRQQLPLGKEYVLFLLFSPVGFKGNLSLLELF